MSEFIRIVLIRFLEEDEWCLDSNLIEIPSQKVHTSFTINWDTNTVQIHLFSKKMVQ